MHVKLAFSFIELFSCSHRNSIIHSTMFGSLIGQAFFFKFVFFPTLCVGQFSLELFQLLGTRQFFIKQENVLIGKNLCSFSSFYSYQLTPLLFLVCNIIINIPFITRILSGNPGSFKTRTCTNVTFQVHDKICIPYTFMSIYNYVLYLMNINNDS